MFELYPSKTSKFGCVGMNIGAMPLKQFRLAFETLYEFEGKTAHVLLGTNVEGVSRANALAFATAFMSGQLVTINIDLKTLTATKI